MASPHRARTNSVEAELKYRLRGAREYTELRKRLKDLGAEHTGTYDEENVRYKTMRGHPSTLRLRILDGGPGAIITAKGPAHYERGIKIRKETEVTVTDADATRELFSMLGREISVVYHKHREVWSFDGCDVTLDTLDFGLFSEVEGPVDHIESVASRLGLGDRRPLKSSYSELARAHLEASRD